MKREFRQRSKLGKIRRWVVTISKGTYSMSDGEVGGKMKVPTTHICEAKNVGKINEMSPQKQALSEAERQIELKLRGGYKEVDIGTGMCLDGGELPVVEEIDFDNPATSTKHYKMPNSLTGPTKKALEGYYAWLLRKRDGNRFDVISNSAGAVNFYTSAYQRGHPGDTDEHGDLIPYAERFKHIQTALYSTGFPARSILLTELVTVSMAGYVDKAGFDIDDLDMVDAIRGSKTDAAIRLQSGKGCLGLCIWDWAWKAGDCLLQTMPFHERMDLIKQLVEMDDTGWLTYPEIATVYEDIDELTIELTSPNLTEPLQLELDEGDFAKTMLAFAEEMCWEGWVVSDPHAIMDEKAWNTRNKWYRPTCVAKLKPDYDVDVIARYDPDNGIGIKGKGAKKVGIGSAECFLTDPRTGEEVSIGNCGNGFTKEDILKYGNPKLYPMVWTLLTSGWTKDGQLWHPRFVAPRDDKTFAECELEQNPKWETHYAEKK